MRFNKKNKILIIVGSVILLIVILLGLWAGLRVKTRLIPNGSVSLASEYSEYLVGENVKIKIQNDFNSTVYFENNCPAEPLDVYRFENNSWVRIHDKADVNKCNQNDSDEGVPPNESRNVSFAAWPNLFNKTGKYRVVAYVEYYDQLPFTDFEIVNKPKVPEIPKVSSNNSPSISNSTPATSSSNTTTPTQSSPSNSTSSSLKSQTIKIAQGTVVVKYDNNTIYVQSIIPTSGCTYEGGRSGKEVEIEFKCNGNEVKLELRIVNGAIVQKIEQDD